MWTLLAILIAFFLDWFFGDPMRIPHIVVYIGKTISMLEKLLRDSFAPTPKEEFKAGIFLVVTVCAVWFALTVVVVLLCGLVHPVLRLVVETFLCWQCLAMKGLKDAGENVRVALETGGIEAGRKAVGMIVGRDTTQLSEHEIIDATVETIAENTSDGEVAPLIYMAIGGAPLAVLYKAINTMDSMVGYITPPYTHFGTAAAKLDDAANWIPARISGLLMCLAAIPAKLSASGAWRIWKRDRHNHRSPNSAQTEAPCAGALGLQLGGDHVYFGELVSKPTIGDPMRQPMRDDIGRANRLMVWTSIFAFVLCIVVRLIVVLALGIA